jgi:hypothetical protein
MPAMVIGGAGGGEKIRGQGKKLGSFGETAQRLPSFSETWTRREQEAARAGRMQVSARLATSWRVSPKLASGGRFGETAQQIGRKLIDSFAESKES